MWDHFNELLLCCVLVGMLVFVGHEAAVHNDELANKGIEFSGQILAALLAIMAAKRLTGGGQPPPSA